MLAVLLALWAGPVVPGWSRGAYAVCAGEAARWPREASASQRPGYVQERD